METMMLSFILNSIAVTGLTSQSNTPPDLISSSVKMFVVLLVVLAAVIIIGRVGRRGMTNNYGKSRNLLIKVLAHQYIGMKKSISLVQVPGAVLVLGISDDNLSLLSKIEDEELLEMIKGHESGNQETRFLSQLRKFSSKPGKGDVTSYNLRSCTFFGEGLHLLKQLRLTPRAPRVFSPQLRGDEQS